MSTTARAVWRAQRVAYAHVAALRESLGLPDVLAWTLVRRGLTDPAQARAFLDASGPLAPPEDLAGIAAAAARVARALQRNEQIAVHGDYDCDGVSSTAAITADLRARGATVRPFLPSRFTEGYGVASATVERLAEEGARLLICVDCGTSATEALERAVELGLDVVVLDHHLAGGVRPPGIIANPALGRSRPDLPAAAGVVHMLARALAARSDAGLLERDPDDDLDIVALATVADAVPLIGDNRRLVVRGVHAIRRNPRPGLAALCDAAGLEPRLVSARSMGFVLAPCINAAGRLAHPDRALELLLAPDAATAEPIARELWELNRRRREVERSIVDEAIAMIEAEPPHIRDADVVMAIGDGWHEGVVGIVASRLVERFERPAIVISREDGRGRGSGRSLPGIDLHGLVARADRTLTRWGGHAGAIGVELPAGRIAQFRDDLIQVAAGARHQIDLARVIPVDAVANGIDLTLEGAEALDALAPFGRGNPPVRLAVPAVQIDSLARVGQGRHLEARLTAGGVRVRAIGFSMGARAPAIDPAHPHDAVVALEVDRWQGVVGPRVSLKALEPVAAADVRDTGCDHPGDVPCPATMRWDEMTARMAAARPARPPLHIAEPAAPPLGVVDRRGEGVWAATATALCDADRGVAVVVADAPMRRRAIAEAIQPWRFDPVAIRIAAWRCGDDGADMGPAGEGQPILGLIDYGRLVQGGVPEGVHLALVDPPTSQEDLAALRGIAAGRYVHLLWGPDEVHWAGRILAWRCGVRAAAAALWVAVRDGRPHGWEGDLERAVLPEGQGRHHPEAIAAALACLAEIGMVAIEGRTVRAVAQSPTMPMERASAHQAAQGRLEEGERLLAVASTLDPLLDEPPVGGEGVG